MLGSEYILKALHILKDQFKDIGGMVDTILFHKDLTRELNSDIKEKNIFVIHTDLCTGLF